MKPKRIVLGVTGGIATGKTTVMKMLAQQGIPGISSDEIAHRAIRKGTPVYRRILKRYGPRLKRAYGQICRTKLGRVVFSNPSERHWLEKQIHPVVIRELKRFIRQHKGLVAIDVPLLFEAKLTHLADKIVVVDAPLALQLRRLKQRNGLAPAEAHRRIAAQMPLSKKRTLADILLRNQGSLADLKKHVLATIYDLQIGLT